MGACKNSRPSFVSSTPPRVTFQFRSRGSCATLYRSAFYTEDTSHLKRLFYNGRTFARSRILLALLLHGRNSLLLHPAVARVAALACSFQTSSERVKLHFNRLVCTTNPPENDSVQTKGPFTGFENPSECSSAETGAFEAPAGRFAVAQTYLVFAAGFCDSTKPQILDTLAQRGSNSPALPVPTT